MRRPPRKRNSLMRQGLTLIEILVVLVILGIAAAMVVPRLSSMGDLQVASAARAMVANVQYAQNEAIITQTPVTVAFDAAAESYQLQDAGGVVMQHPITKRNFVVAFADARGFERVDILSANFNGSAKVAFDPLGSSDQGGQVILSADGQSYRVSIAPVTGKVTAAVVVP